MGWAFQFRSSERSPLRLVTWNLAKMFSMCLYTVKREIWRREAISAVE
jgi:hypothetical protein